MTDGRCALLINPNAGSFNPSLQERFALELAAQKGEVFLSESLEQAEQFVLKASQHGISRLIVFGGDDTLRDLLPALLQSPCELGLIPGGTFNNLALAMQVPFEPFEALQLALSAPAKAIDLGRAGGVLFTESAGIGYLAEAWNRAPQPEPTGYKRWITGFLAASSALVDYHPITVEVTADGETRIEKVWDLTVANCPFFANNITIAPKARLDDGLLDLTLWPAMSSLDFLTFLPRVLSESPEHVPEVSFRQIPSLKVSSAVEIPLRVDNTLVHGTDFVFEILPQALKVVRP